MHQIRRVILLFDILPQPALRLLLRAPPHPLHLLLLLVRPLLLRHPQQLVWTSTSFVADTESVNPSIWPVRFSYEYSRWSILSCHSNQPSSNSSRDRGSWRSREKDWHQTGMDRYRRWMDSELARRKRMEDSVFGCLHSLIIIFKIATTRNGVISGVGYYECNKLSGSWGFRSVGRSHLELPALLAYAHMLGGWDEFIIIAREFVLRFFQAQRHSVDIWDSHEVVLSLQPISHCCDPSLYKGPSFATILQPWYCPVTCASCLYGAFQDAAGSLRVGPVYLHKIYPSCSRLRFSTNAACGVLTNSMNQLVTWTTSSQISQSATHILLCIITIIWPVQPATVHAISP